MCEGRVALSEVVEGNADARVVESCEEGTGAFGLTDDGGLGELDLEIAGRDAMPAEAFEDLVGELFVAQVARGDVDGDGEGECPGLPFGELAERVFEDPVGQRIDESGRFGDLEELRRWQQPARGCCQRTSASTPTTAPVRRSSFGW